MLSSNCVSSSCFNNLHLLIRQWDRRFKKAYKAYAQFELERGSEGEYEDVLLILMCLYVIIMLTMFMPLSHALSLIGNDLETVLTSAMTSSHLG